MIVNEKNGHRRLLGFSHELAYEWPRFLAGVKVCVKKQLMDEGNNRLDWSKLGECEDGFRMDPGHFMGKLTSLRFNLKKKLRSERVAEEIL